MADEKGDVPLVTTVTPAPQDDLVEVVAPMDLQEGYELQVEVNGENRFVRVPAGGVKAGQSFQGTPYVSASTTTTTSSLQKSGVPHHIPTGQWRDGLCDCCTHGCCHAMCCLGFWFEPILVGQVMTRMGRNTFGGPGKHPSVNNTCKIILTVFLVVVVIEIIFSTILNIENCAGGREEYNPDTNKNQIVCPDGSVEEPTDLYRIVRIISSIVSLIFAIYMLINTCRTRYAMRNKYNIDPSCCGSCDDCCCSFWCSCCTVQQMARHTNDYSTYDVACCSSDCCNKRGQQQQVPYIDV